MIRRDVLGFSAAETARMLRTTPTSVYSSLQRAHRTVSERDQVMCLADGVSFVHVSTHDTADGANPLPALPAFQEFNRDVGARVSTPPTPSPATTIGAYRGLGDVVVPRTPRT